ncbi:outer membrane protein assembly factor BamC [secondary endosymbiont of Ctenarytaina eucalypti]|uniref:Putative lipoprotein n=1 Tax=secondary endosymbiont of Ctenarytaina eucalypti TaxID=1199245 RepID=J3VSV8_9ENTR|nr:outer membrane protein assembly factor BamC [secondary endosymbiont of Ctenarytaina eucalypti]AFP85041.1 putative lipoprotein [secondary endosymbiont of Ctenarytaina eucalypti]
MAELQKKSRIPKGIGVTVIFFLSACASEHRHQHQVNGGNEEYLQAPSLHALSAPAGITLPVKNSDYDIPLVSSTGEIGASLDIRPPAQPLALLKGSSSKYANNRAIIQFDNNAHSYVIWSKIISVVKSKGYPIASSQNEQKRLKTDWVLWTRVDEDKQYSGRYQISLTLSGYQSFLEVTSLDLRQQEQLVTRPELVQRYTVEMLNSIASELQKINIQHVNHRSEHDLSNVSVKSAVSESGLPVILILAPYKTVWAHLPEALSRIGIRVKNVSQPLGSITATYDASSKKIWLHLGIEDLALHNGNYKLQVGDLGTRSILQFTDPKGHALTQAKNDALVTVLQVAFS